jgi:hypothetical protein
MCRRTVKVVPSTVLDTLEAFDKYFILGSKTPGNSITWVKKPATRKA